MVEINRGSEWKRWDLHIHTPDSFHEEFKIPDSEKDKFHNNKWEKYYDCLEKIDNVSVLGITDYFSIEGYKKVLKYKNKGNLDNIKLLLPNIEFRIRDTTMSNEKINYHVIFSNEIDVEVIERDFLNQIIISHPETGKLSLSVENIIKIGNVIKKSEGNGGDPYKLGCNYIFVDLNDLIEILNKKIFKGKYLLVLAEKGWNQLNSSSQVRGIKDKILADSNAVFSSNPKTIMWMLGEGDCDKDTFKRTYKSLKPCIHGSDAHNYEKVCKPDENRYCWIKADTTFEGLKTIIYEPSERVKIQEKNPNYRKSIFTIDSLEISNSEEINNELSIKEEIIYFNQDMVAITGGKGSGKTALLDLLANCFINRSRNSSSKDNFNSFVQRIEEDKSDLCTEISFRGDVNSFSKTIIEDTFLTESEIQYLPQGKIDEYSGDSDLLNSQIKKVIYNNKNISENYKEDCENLKQEIEEYLDEIKLFNQKIVDLEEETNEEIRKQLDEDYHLKLGKLKDKKEEYEDFKKDKSQDTNGNIENILIQKNELKIKLKKLNELKEEDDKYFKEYENFENNLGKLTLSINNQLEELKIDYSFENFNLDFIYNQYSDLFDKLDNEEKLINNRLSKIIEVEEKFSEEATTESKLVEDITNIQNEVSLFSERLDELKIKESEIKTNENIRIENYHNYLEKLINRKEKYEEIINIFSEGKDEILKDINFQPKLIFNENQFLDKGHEILDSRRIKEEEFTSFVEEFKSLIEDFSKENIHKTLNNLFIYKQFLLSSYDNLDFYNWVFGNYFTLTNEVFFKRTKMENLSMGQKGMVLLKLFLSEGNYPLIIDQPEDNLDNRFIYKELVSAFKNAKSKRQIIIATNNANLLVNADAEQIIVAEFKNNYISYKSGSLENIEIKKEIMPILEGGEEAFKQREEKYGI